MKIKEILYKIDEIAPFALAEGYDNTGLLVGDENAEVAGVLLALDCTPEVIRRAEESGANLIVTHHPVLFDPVKRLPANSLIYRLAAAGIAVISAHTNLDIAPGGVNDCLAEKLGLGNIRGLSAVSRRAFQKISVFVPESHAAQVREAMAAAGAGRLGSYSGCAAMTGVTGTFLPGPGAHPTLGQVGRQETVPEIKVEMICSAADAERAVEAMKRVHPYEMPAYDIFEDTAVFDTFFIGRIGELAAPLEPAAFAAFVKEALDAPSVRYVEGNRPVKRVALCSGSGGEYLCDSLAAGADAFVTAEVKHHVFLEAERQEITLLDAGHFSTEDVVVEPLRSMLSSAFPGIPVYVAHHSAIRGL